MPNRSILIFLPKEDFNEIEFLIIRNEIEKSGFKIFIVSDAVNFCIGNSGLKVKNDIKLENVNPKNFSAIILVGGGGTKIYFQNKILANKLKLFKSQKRVLAAICLAPVLLAQAGLLNNVNATCYPSNKNELERNGANYFSSPVVSDKEIITANGPDAAVDFVNVVLDKIKVLM